MKEWLKMRTLSSPLNQAQKLKTLAIRTNVLYNGEVLKRIPS
jgi:hypothetical protein